MFKQFGFKEVSANQWAEITGQTAPAANNAGPAASSPALSLEAALHNKNHPAFITALARIPDVAAYTEANNAFKSKMAPNSLVKKTILNAAFDAWPLNAANAEKRAALEREFLRMGLKKTASGQWSLSGLAGLDMLSM